MKKTYVLDTNVILYSSGALLSFGNNDVVIPEVVLEELDDFKKNNTELGLNARQASRIIDGLRKLGNLSEGVPLPGGGNLRIETNCLDTEVPQFWDKNKADNRILQVCKALKDTGEDVILITKDTFERIKADIVNIKSEDFYEKVVPEDDDQYTGRIEVYVSSEKISEFYSKKVISKKDVVCYLEDSDEYYTPILYINQFLIMHSLENKKQSALGRFDGENIVSLHYKDSKPLGISARNVGQRFMLECLFASSSVAPLSIIKGPAGTAKTLFSLAVGLQKIIEEETGEYRKILVCRPNVTMDEEIGFLPGTEEQKISPFMRPIFDNLEVLVDSDEKERYSNEKELQDKINELFDRRIITTEAIAYLRGRSIIRQWVIIDEAQNLSPKQVKAITTRVGIGTKLILIGDPDQIDHPFMDSRSNGLCYASERMKGSKLCYQVTLKYDECERSPLSFEAAQRL
ncbi:MAG TPA: ribonuclease [Clostridium sp.]|nr:ribonuclease [Clostridium sp.]